MASVGDLEAAVEPVAIVFMRTLNRVARGRERILFVFQFVAFMVSAGRGSAGA